MCTSWKFIYLFIFIWTKYEKKLVKVGYLCMGQMMMWDNVVMFPFVKIYFISFVNKFNFVNYISR